MKLLDLTVSRTIDATPEQVGCKHEEGWTSLLEELGKQLVARR